MNNHRREALSRYCDCNRGKLDIKVLMYWGQVKQRISNIPFRLTGEYPISNREYPITNTEYPMSK